jgi:hypothetical protein
MNTKDKNKLLKTIIQNADSPLDCITTGTGYFKAGIKCKIIGGGERVVYLGESLTKTTLPEFTLEFIDTKGKPWTKSGCQYGRDFVFAQAV